MISRAQAQDFLEITDLWEASVRATHHFLPEAMIHQYRPLILNEYLHLVDLYTWREGGQILGFLGLAGHKVEMLFIHPAARGQGIGRQLMNYAIQQHGVYEVDVNEQNEQAVGFYLRLGFEVINRSPLDAQGQPFPILHLVVRRE